MIAITSLATITKIAALRTITTIIITTTTTTTIKQ